MPKVIITGSNGYLGGALRGCFQSRGWTVIKLQRRWDSIAERSDNIEWDLRADKPPNLPQAEALIHCAFDFARDQPNAMKSINVEGTELLLRAVAHHSIAKTVVVSSASAYPHCRSIYGQTKCEIERIVARFGAVYVRPGLLFGGKNSGLIGNMLAATRKMPILPDLCGLQGFQYLTHVEDLSQFIVDFCDGENEFGSEDQSKLLANPKPHTLTDIIRKLAHLHGLRPMLVPVWWRIPWLFLKLLEQIHLKPNFRSDSMIGLAFSNARPLFYKPDYFREFNTTNMALG